MIDFKDPSLHISIINKQTNEVIVSGFLTTSKNLPELMISFDSKYFFKVRQNPLYEIKITDTRDSISFDTEKYKDWISFYKGIEMRDHSNQYVFREFSIDELDPEIAPLVYALNEAGYKTTGSCCGHEKRPAWIHISFEDFVTLKKLIEILQKPEFKFDFQLTTCSDVTEDSFKEIRLSLQTMDKGKKAYQNVLKLANFLEQQAKRLSKLHNLKM